MKTTLRIVSVLILASMIFTMIACSKTDDPDAGAANTTAANEGDDPADTSEGAAEPVEIMPELPEKDFGGYEFSFLVRFNEGAHWAPWNARDIYAESETGEPINDAVYARNRFVEQQFNCVIKEFSSAKHAADLKKMVKAGDDTHSIYYAGLNELVVAALDGSLLNLEEDVPYVDLNAPWWNGNAAHNLSVGNQLFFAPSDLMVMDNDCTSAIVFNKQMIKDFGLDNPYDLVHSGKWTIDNLTKLARTVTGDVDGNGTFDENDKYGFVSYRDAVLSLMHSSGGRIAKKDNNDLPYLSLGEQHCYDALNKAFDLMYDPSSFNVHHLEGKYDAIYEVTEKMFMENRSLFYWILLHDVEKFRNMDADFGILPLPKFDESQTEYGHTVNQYHSHGISIPVTADPERTGIILEALTAKSKYTLQPAYYDVTLQRKISRDEESREMLDIIFSSRVYDIGAINNWGNYSWEIIAMTMKNNREIVSLYEKYAVKAQKDLDKTISNYEKIKDSKLG